MSAAANKDRLRLLMLAKKKTKDKPKRAASAAPEPVAPVQVAEPAAEAAAAPESKRARVEELSEPMMAVPVDESGLVNVEAELERFFAATRSTQAELVPEEELEEADRGEPGEEDEEGAPLAGPAAENELSAVMRQRIFSHTKAKHARAEEEKEEESDLDEDADIFAGL